MASRALNPYVGPRAFEETDSHVFFGRGEETRQLASLVIAQRAVLLYAPSGAGKTSLLNASLVPRLKQRKRIVVLPVSRVGGDLSPGVDGAKVRNIYVFNALLSLVGEDAQVDELVGLTLGDGLKNSLSPRPDERRTRPRLLILDQFEELFTTHPGRYEERTDFFSQLQDCLLAYPQLSILLSMREDYIAHLDSYAAQLPDRLRTRYRLELLEQAAALEAVKNPAHQVGVDFSEAAAHKLVDDLRRMRVQRLDGTTGEQLGPHVEPVQLQVVCRRLWDKLPPDTTQIVEPDVEAVGDVDIALSGYYAERVGSIADQAGISERAIRDWFDRHLITEQGIRGQVLQGAEQSEGLDNRAIWPLVDAHLVRAEKRRGATWFELAHDRLIEPVRADNAAWRESHLSVFQRQAALWESQDQPPSLLLSDQALAEAEEWITTHGDELTDAERDFLEECRQAVEHAALEEQVRYTARLRKLRLWALGETIGFVLAIISLLFINAYTTVASCGFFLFAVVGVVCALAVLTSTISLSTAEMLERRRAKK